LRAIKGQRKQGDVFDDLLCVNGWRWEWVSMEHEIKCNGKVVRRERSTCSYVFAVYPEKLDAWCATNKFSMATEA
jgi:hypothetical protein